MATTSPSTTDKIKKALAALSSAAQELANVIDESGYIFSSPPDYLNDVDDFAYELAIFVEDEIEELNITPLPTK